MNENEMNNSKRLRRKVLDLEKCFVKL